MKSNGREMTKGFTEGGETGDFVHTPWGSGAGSLETQQRGWDNGGMREDQGLLFGGACGGGGGGKDEFSANRGAVKVRIRALKGWKGKTKVDGLVHLNREGEMGEKKWRRGGNKDYRAN